MVVSAVEPAGIPLSKGAAEPQLLPGFLCSLRGSRLVSVLTVSAPVLVRFEVVLFALAFPVVMLRLLLAPLGSVTPLLAVGILPGPRWRRPLGLGRPHQRPLLRLLGRKRA